MPNATRPPRLAGSVWNYRLVGNEVLYLPLYRPDMVGSTIYSKDRNRHACTVTGATWGIQGRSFGGDGDNILSDSVASAPTAFIALTWWKRLGNSGGATSDLYHAVLRGINGYNPNCIFVSKDGTTVNVAANIGGVGEVDTIAITAADWHLIGSIWTGSSLYATADGTVGAGNETAGTLEVWTHKVLLGIVDATTYLTNGIIGDAWIINQASSLASALVVVNRIYWATKWRYQ